MFVVSVIASKIKKIVLFGLILSLSSFVSANTKLETVKFCVWDPVGSTGPFISFLKQTKLKAISWGVDLQLDAYTDEKVASNDFRSGVCDAVFLTNILGKDFVPFSAAFGAPDVPDVNKTKPGCLLFLITL